MRCKRWCGLGRSDWIVWFGVKEWRNGSLRSRWRKLAPPIAAPAGATDGPMVLSYAAPGGDDDAARARRQRTIPARVSLLHNSPIRVCGERFPLERTGNCFATRQFYLLKASRGSAGLAGGLLGMAITVACSMAIAQRVRAACLSSPNLCAKL